MYVVTATHTHTHTGIIEATLRQGDKQGLFYNYCSGLTSWGEDRCVTLFLSEFLSAKNNMKSSLTDTGWYSKGCCGWTGCSAV